MKRSTLILILIAAALGAFVYFYEVKRGKSRDAVEETAKPAFSFNQDDIATITVTRSGETYAFEKRDGEWVITQPINTRADQSAIDSIASGVATARVNRTLSSSPDNLKSYGLENPAVTVEIKLKNGNQHRVRLGAKDFSGLNVYALLDGSNEVALLPDSVLSSADRPLPELRDRSVLNISQWDVVSFDLKNSSGEITVAKQESNWVIKQPRETAADESEVSSLLSQITSAKMTEVVSETADDLTKYGLSQPGLSFRVRLQKGDERALIVGNKVDEHYFARDTTRSQIFRIDSELYKKLSDATFSLLRDKRVVSFKQDEITRVSVKNSNQTVVCEKNSEGKWIVKEPADNKDKEAQSWRLFNPIENTKAKEIIDSPSRAILAKLAKPAVEMELTDKSGKTTKISISSADGDDVYVRTSSGPSVYKLGKQILDDLNFKVSDIVL